LVSSLDGECSSLLSPPDFNAATDVLINLSSLPTGLDDSLSTHYTSIFKLSGSWIFNSSACITTGGFSFVRLTSFVELGFDLYFTTA
jgi:hypothetical protein